MPSEFGGFRKVTSEILKKRENEKNTYLGMPVVKEKTKENYQEYLKSEHWKNLRDKKKKKFKVKKRKCGICRFSENLEVHHLIYRDWYNVSTSDLRVLCRGCHALIHQLQKDKVLFIGKHLSHHGIFTKCKIYVLWAKKQDKYKQFHFDKKNRII